MKLNVKIAQKKKSEIQITTEFIRLDSALKLCNAVESGGQAKSVIQDGQVSVNGEVCVLRGKKLRPGDNFEFMHCVYSISM